MGNSTIQAAQGIDTSSKLQTSQAVTLQMYCNSVLSQPTVDLSSQPNLSKFTGQINNGMTVAKGHANDYLNNIQPLIITNVTNISNYYALHNAVATTLPPGSTVKEWVSNLNVLKDQSVQYQSDAKNVVSKLQTLNGNIGIDSAAFSKIVSDLNAAVNGDNGVLQSIDGQLGTIQSSIDGAIAGIALSGLAILGGIFVTAVGAIADFVTLGTSTPLVVGGIALIIAGVGGEVASAVTLKNLNDQKNKLLIEKSNLKSEVNLALGMSSGYTSLNNQAQSAMTAATQMSNAWNFLSGDLGNLASDLEKGITSTDQARTIFLTAANTVITSVIQDVTIIKNQMAGVISSVAPIGSGGSKSTTIGDYIVSEANKYAKAA